MEANKIKGEAKSIVVENGLELTFCEYGTENDGILLTGAFYYDTAIPLMEELGKRYHVYGMVMRFDGPCEELNSDGSVNWARQWGRDMYYFARALGLDKFTYFGKCHGSIPGWFLVKEHPEMLECFFSFFMAPHLKPQTSAKWAALMAQGPQMLGAGLRKKELLPWKVEEMKTIGGTSRADIIMAYGAAPEKIWPTLDDCEQALQTMTIPVGYCFGTHDLVNEDFYDANLYAVYNTRGARSIFLQGECHFMEMDCPQRIADELHSFIETSKKDYFHELLTD